MKQKIVIVGATSAMAEHCARLWVKVAPVELTLIGRHAARLERVAADLRTRSPESVVRVLEGDFQDPVAIQATVDTVAAGGPIHIALIAHGFLPEQSHCENNLVACSEALSVNGISPVLFAEGIAQHMIRENSGCLAIIGSVAGDRGRKSNYVYGSAKGMIERYAQGLQHRVAGTGVQVTLIKPGPTDSPMTAHLKEQGLKLAPVDEVSKTIVDGIERGQAVIYAPARWLVIMFIIRHLPRFVFNKLNI
jgi:decaprenylphospho-beta-D-erythro-pentofuranosid-2-ulose 2-reductase